MYYGGECWNILAMVFLISHLVQSISLNGADLTAWFSVFLFYFYDGACERRNQPTTSKLSTHQEVYARFKRERERADVCDTASAINLLVLNLIVRVKIGLGEWPKFGLVWGQFGDFQASQFYRLKQTKLKSACTP